MAHTCHALGCTVEVPERIFMHREHWYMVPKPLRDAIWRTYRPGQEITKTPSNAYVAAATAAIAAVAMKERKGKTSEEWQAFLDTLPEETLAELFPQITSLVAGARREHEQSHEQEGV